MRWDTKLMSPVGQCVRTVGCRLKLGRSRLLSSASSFQSIDTDFYDSTVEQVETTKPFPWCWLTYWVHGPSCMSPLMSILDLFHRGIAQNAGPVLTCSVAAVCSQAPSPDELAGGGLNFKLHYSFFALHCCGSPCSWWFRCCKLGGKLLEATTPCSIMQPMFKTRWTLSCLVFMEARDTIGSSLWPNYVCLPIWQLPKRLARRLMDLQFLPWVRLGMTRRACTSGFEHHQSLN